MGYRYHVYQEFKGLDCIHKVLLGVFNDLDTAREAIMEECDGGV